MNNQLWWYVARSCGLVAWALLAASVLWGLALSTKVMRGRPRPNWILDLHRFLGGLALVFTGIHVAALMLDSYVHFGVAEVLVPFASEWHPVAVAWGVVGLYLLVAVEVTSLLRKRISKRTWRLTHFLSFPLFVLTTAHALSAGTDRSTLLRWGVIAVSAAITGLTFVRLRRMERGQRNGPHRTISPTALASGRDNGPRPARRRRPHPARLARRVTGFAGFATAAVISGCMAAGASSDATASPASTSATAATTATTTPATVTTTVTTATTTASTVQAATPASAADTSTKGS